jgi:uncharacterized protein (TIGR02246 family)
MDHYAALLQLVNSDSVAAMYTEDGEMTGNSCAPHFSGREAIRRFLAPFDGHAHVDTAIVRTSSITVGGDTAHVAGSYHQMARLDSGKAGTFDGAIRVVWVRQPDGNWRIARFETDPVCAGH